MKKLIAFCILAFGIALHSQAQTVPKGNVTEVVNGGRVVDWKEITVDSLPYFKNQGLPFSVFITPKVLSNTTEVEIINLRGYQGDVIRSVPLSVNQWNVISATLFPVQTVNTSLFTNYRVFLGFGQTAN